MPQEIRVLCCYKCKIYQSDIVKKAKKWQCKMCQEKQNVFKEFFRGSGAECRVKVQELNLNVNVAKTEVENEFLSLLDRDNLDIDLESILNENNFQKRDNNRGQLRVEDSKWTKYVETKQEQHNVDPFPTEPSRNLKRRSSGTSPAAEFHSAKNPRSLMSTSSKWNKYL